MQSLARSKPDSIYGVRGQLNDINNRDEEFLNPVFGFRRNLIGLIGNLVYENKPAQDYLRESEGLAALLDCAKIDERNPFILQWSIFAIRNSLQKNEQNQNFIIQLKKQGNVSNEFVNKVRFC